ncbi:transcription termination factor 2-like isoform X2 [Aphis gossypii]|uniref:transcription termination factor 2-like isoform X2 n=1 Tax=Aphis gossypii TaxID=80765 RepID=UPI0021596D6F|nr:transcription termination factor 2-like isoform X2 [Aphis gossypii]
MKSSRSTSSKLPSRFARRLMSESSDDSDDGASSNSHMDSARAEKAFSRRKRQTPTLDEPNVKNDSTHIQSDRTLFRLSDTSDSEESDRNSKIDKKQSYHDKTTSSDGSINESIFKPSKRDMAKYRNILHSSDDEKSKNSNLDESSDDSSSKKSLSLIESDESGEECLLEEYMDKPIDTTNIIANESFKPLRKFKTNQAIILDSSEESQTMTKNICNETNLILESDSEDNIISSPHKTFQIPKNVNREESHIEAKLNDLSLIEPSDSDDELSAHQKSTVTSSKQNRPFIDDLKFSNTIYSLHDPISQSSILEYPNSDNVNIEQSSNIKKNEKIIETIDLIGDSPKTSKLCLPPKHHDLTIDLTDEKVDGKSSVLSKDILINDSKKPMSEDFQSLKMEKIRLEELLRRFTKNIANMKNTMKITNLNLLPDGGYKLKRAIIKEESALRDTTTQFNNVLKKLEDEPKVLQKPHSNYLQTLDINNALTKKAAGNIDIKAMGDKALNTYRTQQTMTLDVLNSLHKSLGTCPSSNILADDPQTLKVELMPHQKHAIAWLMWREIQKPHGGVLADDMGLGKTLTMISLILKAYETKKDQSEDSDTDDSFEDSNHNSFKGGTLIVCPSSLIGQWENELKSKVKPRVLDSIKYYGASREPSARKLAKKHIVITTYNTVMWDQKNNKRSPLYQIKWCRIILDEAHTIRNPKSQTSVAVCSLSGINRWALTGTPIHNKEADFYALLKFIKCRPFDEWAVWKRWVGNNDDAGKNRLSLLIKALMLRRTKDQLKETTSFDLPPKTFHTIKVDLFKEEKEAYEKVLQFSSTLFAKYLYEKAEKENAVERGFPVINKAKYLSQNSDNNIFKDHPELDKLFKQLLNNKNIQAHHILVLILRLRQLCCHPCLLKNMLEDESLKVDGIQDIGDVDIVDHLSRMSIGVPSVEKDTVKNSNVIFKETWISSKIKAVCDMVKEKVLCTEDKAVIVSQWPSVLNLVNKQLSQYNVKTEIFSGVVPVLLRNKMISEFNKVNSGPKILLLSLTAGGVGLNLVVANHLFLVDIHWNPQLEAQACDRIYRVGQQKPVNVYKFVCNDTIETSIQTIQTKKIEIANNVFGGYSNVEGNKITLDDLKVIFNINPNKVKT